MEKCEIDHCGGVFGAVLGEFSWLKVSNDFEFNMYILFQFELSY